MNKDITAITCNWLTARRTLGAIKSFNKFYPDVPFIVIDDGSDPDDKYKFNKIYSNNIYCRDLIYDPDNDKLKDIPNVKYIQVPTHRRHGESIDYVLPQIKTKWVFHMDSDVRLIKAGLIEYMMEGIKDNICGIGIEKTRNNNYPKVSNSVFIFNADLARKYKSEGAIFTPIYEFDLEANVRYFKVLTDKGWKIRYCDDEIKKYYIHLRYKEDTKYEWHKYY